MPERLLSFLLKFIFVSGLLALLWFWKGLELYQVLSVGTVNFISGIAITNLTLPVPTAFFHNLIPFTALILISPPYFNLQKLWLLLLGWFILFVEHLVVAVILYFLLDFWQVSQSTYELLFTPLSVLSGAFPFILWLVLLKDRVKQLFVKPAHSNSPK